MYRRAQITPATPAGAAKHERLLRPRTHRGITTFTIFPTVFLRIAIGLCRITASFYAAAIVRVPSARDPLATTSTCAVISTLLHRHLHRRTNPPAHRRAAQ
jgi:hypothetical protein